jgi:hypothetical protein
LQFFSERNIFLNRPKVTDPESTGKSVPETKNLIISDTLALLLKRDENAPQSDFYKKIPICSVEKSIFQAWPYI